MQQAASNIMQNEKHVRSQVKPGAVREIRVESVEVGHVTYTSTKPVRMPMWPDSPEARKSWTDWLVRKYAMWRLPRPE